MCLMRKISVFALSGLFLLPLPLQGETHTGSTSDSGARETRRFSEYDTVATKFTNWFSTTTLELPKIKLDGETLVVEPSKSVFEKSAAILKRIKWYRERIADTCDAIDPSAQLLGEAIDTCFAPGLLSESVKNAKKTDSSWEHKFDYKKLYTCKNEIRAYFKAKQDVVGTENRSKFNIDWELDLKFTELFDLWIGRTEAPKLEAKAIKMVDELQKVSPLNRCQIEEGAKKAQPSVTPAASASPQPTGQLEDKSATVQAQVQTPPANAAVQQQQATGGYGAGGAYGGAGGGYGAGGTYGSGGGYGAGGYGAGGAYGANGQYKFDPNQYQFNPNAYKFDPNRYRPENQNYDGGGYNPLPYFPQPNYNKDPNYKPSSPQYFPPPRPSVDRDPVQQPMPQYPQPAQQPQYPIIPPYMPPPAPVTPYLIGAGGGFSISSGGSSYRPPYVMQEPLNLGGLGLGIGMGCQLGTPCPQMCLPGRCQQPIGGCMPNLLMPQMPCTQQRPGFGTPNINVRNQQPPNMGFPGMSVPPFGFPGIQQPGYSYPPSFSPSTSTMPIDPIRYRVPRAISRTRR